MKLTGESALSEEVVVVEKTKARLHLPFRNVGIEPAFDVTLKLTMTHKASVKISHSVCSELVEADQVNKLTISDCVYQLVNSILNFSHTSTTLNADYQGFKKNPT